jgi:hypothetical protein
MKSFAILLLLGQDVLADRVTLKQQRNPAGSGQKRDALDKRLKQFSEGNMHLDLDSDSLEALASKSAAGKLLEESPFQATMRSLTGQTLGVRKSPGVMDFSKRP